MRWLCRNLAYKYLHILVLRYLDISEFLILIPNNFFHFYVIINRRGQLGLAELRVEETPQLLEALAGIKVYIYLTCPLILSVTHSSALQITQIAAGGWHSAAISAFGDLYTWGLNCSGQLGMRVMKPGGVLKEPTVFPLPQLQDLPECACSQSGESNDDCAPLRVFAGSRHTLLIRRCGRLWVSGWCKHGQLGRQLQDLSYVDAFQALEGITMNPTVDDVLCGPWSTLLHLKVSLD